MPKECLAESQVGTPDYSLLMSKYAELGVDPPAVRDIDSVLGQSVLRVVDANTKESDKLLKVCRAWAMRVPVMNIVRCSVISL